MNRILIVIILTLAVSSLIYGQNRSNKMQAELLKLGKEFEQAIVKNDAEAIRRFLADDWIIIDPDGGIIDKARFLGVIKSGALTHAMMESEEVSVRIYGDTALVTALAKTRGKFMGQDFTTQERATDVFVKQNGRWRCVLTQLTKTAPKEPKEKVTTSHASGTFEVKLLPQDDKTEDASLGRMTIDKQYHGDLEAVSKGQMLSAAAAVQGSAGYVAIEKVSGTLHGRRGSFVLQHSGTMTRGAPELSVTVVPDSATDQLAGLAGRMTIKIADGKHFYDFEYTLAKTP